MHWNLLHSRIRYLLVLKGPEVQTPVYEGDDGTGVWVSQPGKHWKTHDIPGGDFKVVLRAARGGRPLTMSYRKVMDDTQEKREWAMSVGGAAIRVVEDDLDAVLRSVLVEGRDPGPLGRRLAERIQRLGLAPCSGLPLPIWLTAIQCFALAEERRYGVAQSDRGGGRFLLGRVLRGVLLGKWTSEEARQVTTSTSRASGGTSGGLSALRELESLKGWPSMFADRT